MSIHTISRIAFLAVFILVIFLIFQFPKVVFDSNVFSLFPNATPNKARDRAEDLMSEYVSDKVFVLLSGVEFERLKEGAKVYAQHLQNSELIKTIVLEQSSESIETLAEYYRQYPGLLLADKDKLALKNNSDDFLHNKLMAFWTNPGQLSSKTFTLDPLSLSDAFLKQVAGSQTTNLTVRDGYLVSEAEGEVISLLIQVVLAKSSFSIATQEATYNLLESAKHKVHLVDPDINVMPVGTFFFSYSGTKMAQQEISTVGLGSLIGIVLLLLVVFRSLPVMLISLLPAAVGIFAGVVVVNMLFSNVHMVTLVFGASLIGVSIDYSFHFLTTRLTMGKAWQPEAGLRRILSGLSMGLFTSASAYLCFVFSGFPGFKQIAVFSSVGLFVAYLFVVGVFPLLLRKPSYSVNKNYFIHACFSLFKRYSLFWLKFKKVKYYSVAGVSLFCMMFVLGAFVATYNDDIREMQSLDKSLLKDSVKFAEITGQKNGRRYFLVSGKDETQVFERLHRLKNGIYTAGLNVQLQSIDQWIPPVSEQQDNKILVQEKLLTGKQLYSFLEKLSVNSDTLQSILVNYQGSEWVTLGQAYPVVEKVAGFPALFKDTSGLHAIVIVYGDEESQKLQKMVGEGVLWVDTVRDMNLLLVSYRIKSITLLLSAYALVLCFLSIRYGLNGALSVIAPPALASVTALLVLSILGSSISIFHIMAMLLILGIGIDYTIFLRESRHPPQEVLFAIGLSVITTILAFGLLSLSATAAIHGFGLTLLVGIVVCFLLAPSALSDERVNEISLDTAI